MVWLVVVGVVILLAVRFGLVLVWYLLFRCAVVGLLLWVFFVMLLWVFGLVLFKVFVVFVC